MAPAARSAGHVPPLERIAAIDREIRAGRFPDASSLALTLEVSASTVDRDLEYLRSNLHAPLEWNAPRAGYAYSDTTYQLPLTRVPEGELLAALTREVVVREFAGTPFEARIRKIYRKATAELKDNIAVSGKELSECLSRHWVAAPASVGGIYDALKGAISRHETLEVLYHTRSRDLTRWRKIDPLHLVNVDGAWYLLAYCHIHKRVRVFLPAQIQEHRATGERFTAHSAFDAVHFLKARFHPVTGEDAVVVRIRFWPPTSELIATRDWEPGHQIQYRTDGGVDLLLSVENAEAVARWSLGFGNDAEIISPPWVRRHLRVLLHRMEDRYSARVPAKAAAAPKSPQALPVRKPPSKRKS